jgi:hypothetical protein
MMSGAFNRAKVSYLDTTRNFVKLCYINIPYILLTILLAKASALSFVSFEGFYSTVTKNTIEENAVIFVQYLPILIPQYLYFGKALRASMRLFCEGLHTVSEYRLLRFNKAELSFIKVAFFYSVLLGLLFPFLLFVLGALFMSLAALPASLSPSNITHLILGLAPVAAIVIAIIFCVMFLLRSVFILPAKATGQPLKIRSSIQFSKGSTGALFVTLFLVFIPVSIVIILTGILPSNIEVYVDLLISIIWGMLGVAVICNHYNQLMERYN